MGELSPQPDQWDRLSDDAQGTAGPLRYLVHRDEQAECDGVANFRLPWLPAREDAGTLVVEALQAATPEAFAV